MRAGSREEGLPDCDHRGTWSNHSPAAKSKGVGKDIPPAPSSCWCLLWEVRRLGSHMMEFEGASSQGTEKGRECMGEGQATGE